MRPLLQVLGFLAFLLGILSLILNLVGMRFIFLRFIDRLPGIWAIIIQVILIFGGMIVFYLASQRDSFKS